MPFLKRFLTSGIVALLCVSSAFAGTITGVVQNPQSGPVANGTLNLTLTQSANVVGTATVVPTTVSCYTDANGNVVGEPNPLALPVVSSNLASGTLGSGIYFVRLTYQDGTGETVSSPEISFSMTGTGTLIVAAPVLQPSNVTAYRVYIGTSSGTETLQGSVSVSPGSWGQFNQSTTLTAGASLPVSNTTACKVRFNDEMTPSFTGYNTGLTSADGTPIPGYPQLWYLSGGSAGTINLSSGTPLYSGIYTVIYPQAIVTTPPFNATQSISGGLNLNGFNLFAGGLFSSGNGSISGNFSVLGALTVNNIDNVLWVDGVKYTTLAACYADIPSTGGTCHVPPNYSETLAATITLNKNNSGFVFEGPATITMGSNQIIISQGTGGVFITGPSIVGGSGVGGSLTTAGLRFIYTGSGTAIPVGGGSSATSSLKLENFFVDLTGAGSAAVGVDLINVHGGLTVKNIFFNGKGGAVTQSGLLLDDAGGCSGACGTWDGIIEGNWFAGLGVGIGCNGNIQETAFINNIFFAGATSGVAFNINCSGGGNGGYVFGNTVSAYSIGYNFTSGATAGWELHINGNSNTTDILFASGSSNNSIYWDNSQTGPIISDSSGATSNNHVYIAGYNGLLNQQPATAALTGNSGDQTIYTYTLPARALPPGKCIDVEYWANHNTGTAAVTLKIFLGATTWGSNVTSAAGGQIYERTIICNNAGSITAQNGSVIASYPGTVYSAFAPLTAAENTANAEIVKVTFNVANTDQVTGGKFITRMVN